MCCSPRGSSRPTSSACSSERSRPAGAHGRLRFSKGPGCIKRMWPSTRSGARTAPARPPDLWPSVPRPSVPRPSVPRPRGSRSGGSRSGGSRSIAEPCPVTDPRRPPSRGLQPLRGGHAATPARKADPALRAPCERESRADPAEGARRTSAVRGAAPRRCDAGSCVAQERPVPKPGEVGSDSPASSPSSWSRIARTSRLAHLALPTSRRSPMEGVLMPPSPLMASLT